MNSSFALLVIGADSAVISRPTKDNLPEQTLMELLVSGLHAKIQFQSTNGDFKDIQTWDGLRFRPSQSVQSIEWTFSYSDDEDDPDSDEEDGDDFPSKVYQLGSIDLHWLPLELETLEISHLRLHGTVETGNLPSRLREFDICDNSFCGTFSIQGLPQSLEKLNAENNSFVGSLDMEALPKTLTDMSVAYNRFDGTLDLQNLPNLENLGLEGNKFVGSVDLSSLPDALKTIRLHTNKISQDLLIIDNHSANLQHVSFDSKKIVGFQLADGSIPEHTIQNRWLQNSPVVHVNPRKSK